MININCSSSCVYQKDGKCTLDKVSASTLNVSHENCIYYKKAEPASKKEK